MADYLRKLVELQKSGEAVGIYSACTGNSLTLEACMRHAKETGTVLLIESTANQVDQYGGYTGMKPADFMKFCTELAKRVGLPIERMILGGDHLGPLTFAKYDEAKAMSESSELIYYSSPEVEQAINKLFENFKDGVPLGLLDQFLPIQYTKVRNGELANDPKTLVLDRVCNCIDEYLYGTQQQKLD